MSTTGNIRDKIKVISSSMPSTTSGEVSFEKCTNAFFEHLTLSFLELIYSVIM